MNELLFKPGERCLPAFNISIVTLYTTKTYANNEFIFGNSVFHFTSWLLTELAYRFYPHMEGLPGLSIRLLHRDQKKHAVPFGRELLAQWKAIVAAEAASDRGDESAPRVLACAPTRKLVVNRMLWIYPEHEFHTDGTKIGPVSSHIARSLLHAVFPRTKIVEVCNGFVRDASRTKREKTVPMYNVFSKMLDSEALSSLGVKEPIVNLSDVAQAKNFASKESASKSQKIFHANVKEMKTSRQ